MRVLIKPQAFFILLAITAVAVLGACGSPSKPATMSQPQEQMAAPGPADKKPATQPATTAPSPTPQANRVEVVFFHMPWRCAACKCFEERISYVVNTYFQNELAAGRMTFAICNLADRQKAPLFRKYDAFASQLFVNTVVDNTDNIKNIEDIWRWNCESDKPGFDAKVRDVVEQAVKKIS